VRNAHPNYLFKYGGIQNALRSVTVNNIRGEVHFDAECSDNVPIFGVIVGDVVVAAVEKLELVSCKTNVNSALCPVHFTLRYNSTKEDSFNETHRQ
jgi:hypothetical protein